MAAGADATTTRSYRDRVVARLELFFIVGVLASTIAALVIGLERWREWLYVVIVAVGVSLPLLIHRRSGDVVRDLVLLASIGLFSTTLISGGLHAPWLIALVTLSAAAAALLSPRHARVVLLVALCVLAADVAIELLAFAPLHRPPPAYDRSIDGAGRVLAVCTHVGVVFVAMVPGGAVVRLALLETARAVELESMAKAETVTSLEARSLLLSRMTDALANELAEPLTRLAGRLEALKRVSSGADLERLVVLARETERFAQLLPQGTKRQAMTPRAVLEEVVASHQALAEARGAKLVLAPLTAHIAAQAEARFDAQPLRQILVNLVQNAIDVSPQGSAIDLRIVGTTVHIEDRGPGLDPDTATKLFTSGFTTKPGGNGIGLVVARALAERLGGTLALQPREGGGCRATLKLPNDSPWQTVPR